MLGVSTSSVAGTSFCSFLCSILQRKYTLCKLLTLLYILKTLIHTHPFPPFLCSVEQSFSSEVEDLLWRELNNLQCIFRYGNCNINNITFNCKWKIKLSNLSMYICCRYLKVVIWVLVIFCTNSWGKQQKFSSLENHCQPHKHLSWQWLSHGEFFSMLPSTICNIKIIINVIMSLIRISHLKIHTMIVWWCLDINAKNKIC